MSDRIRRELELVERHFGELEYGPNFDWFVVNAMPLRAGWSKPATRVLLLLPGGYPTTPPDNFYADPDLRLTDGGVPGNASVDQQAAGGTWLQFSYHVDSGDWQPAPESTQGHNLLTFVEAAARRLAETS